MKEETKVMMSEIWACKSNDPNDLGKQNQNY